MPSQRDFSWSNEAPAGKALASYTPDNGAPTAKALPAYAGNNAAPVAAVVTGFAGVNVGATPMDLAGFAGVNDAASAHTVPAFKATNDVPDRIDEPPATLPLPTDKTMHTPSLRLTGLAALAKIFGFYQAISTIAISGMQLAVETAPVGGDLTVLLVNDAGVSYGQEITIASGATQAAVTFNAPIALAPGAIVKAKVTHIGAADTPGAYLNLTLIAQRTP